MSDKQDKATLIGRKPKVSLILLSIWFGFLGARNPFQETLDSIKLGGLLGFLVLPTGFNLCICHTDILYVH
jgi:hypothetical protein